MDNANFPAESLVPSPGVADFEERVEHRYAENEGVRIYYAGRGTPYRHAPRLPGLLVHLALPGGGTLRKLSRRSPDPHGYDLSGKPKGIESYGIRTLLGDVRVVIREIAAGHGWGGGSR